MIPNNKRRRKSAQREKIYRWLASRGDHPSAAQAYRALKADSPSASLGNVYRNLRILAEEGRVKSRDFGDGLERFDAVTAVHYHFACERCGAVSDFKLPMNHDVEKMAQPMTRHKITGHVIQFFGICASCLKREKRQRGATAS